MSSREHVAITSRVCGLAAVVAVWLATGTGSAARSVVVVVVVGGMSAYVTFVTRRTTLVLLVTETTAIAVVLGLSLPQSRVLMPYLVVLAFVAGLYCRLPGALVTMTGQVVGLVVTPLAARGVDSAGRHTLDLVPWLITGLGAGMLGVWSGRVGLSGPVGGTEDYYESARQLLTQLRTVTRRLSAGLDSERIAAVLMATMHERLDDSVDAVFVRTEGSLLVPLAYRGVGARALLAPDDPLMERCWEEMALVHGIVPTGPVEGRHRVLLPLRVGSRMIGVAVSSAPDTPSPEQVEDLLGELDAHSLRLDTALVFDEIRTLATADERHRLARDIHDGIAQEIASLGYLVEDMASGTADPKVAQGLHELRAELSRVVADLRLSIFDLRSDVSATNGLGAALSDYVRQVGAESHLTVHLTLREAPLRLAPTVEAELFWIAQEAITNVRRHASAENLWVDCWTDPPRAGLVIRDDGAGIQGRRTDSFGMSIMRERAERIDATLEIGGSSAEHGRGTVVKVIVADSTIPPPRASAADARAPHQRAPGRRP
jgi:signal transduction histidine kinase